MNILFVNACVRSESRTYRLAQKVLQKLGGQVTEVNLEKENIQPLTRQRIFPVCTAICWSGYHCYCRAVLGFFVSGAVEMLY